MKLVTILTLLTTVVLSTLALPTDPTAQQVLYNQYNAVKVLRVPVGENTAPIDELVSSLGLERWTLRSIPKGHVDVEVPQAKYAKFVRGVRKISAQTNVTRGILVMHENLAQSIKEESAGSSEPVRDPLVGLANDAWFNAYHPYADHIQFLTDLVATFPNNAKLVYSGTSFEGRPITGINIYGSSGSGTRPAVVVHGTVHAREWISTMVTEALPYYLLRNAAAGVAEVKAYLEKYDFYFYPIVNPDGFAYSQTSSNNRMWRKNRRTPPSGSNCSGVDINRNWPHHEWGKINGGASTDPCKDDYRGTEPASESETQGLVSFLSFLNSAAGVKLFLDVHSYGQFFVYPYGYTCLELVPDSVELDRVSDRFVEAVAIGSGGKIKYQFGPSCVATRWKTVGDSTDYTYDEQGIKYSFTVELPPSGELGTKGFILPPDQIIPVSNANWAGFKQLLTDMK